MKMPESLAGSFPGLLLLLAMPLALHLPELLGLLSCNPMYTVSGLGSPTASLTYGFCWVDGNTGSTVQALAGLSARQILSGSLPWWNHFSGAGLPLAAEMQSSSFFLPFILLLTLFDGILYLNIVLRVLSGVFTYMFLRELGLGRFGATLGGVLFELNGTFTFLGDAPIHPIPFLPLLMFGIENCRKHALAGSQGGQMPVALAIAFSLLAGFPEVALSDGVLALLWSLARLDMPRRLWISYLGRIVAGGCCGLLLASPALVPFLHDLPKSSIGLHVFSRSNTVDTARIAAVLFPDVFGAPFADGQLAWDNFWGYVTPASALLSLAALAAAPFDRRRLLLLGWFIFCLGGACGVPPLRWLHSVLPAFNQVDFGRFVGPSAEFCCVLLSALALDQWVRGSQRLRLGVALSILLALATAALLASWRTIATTARLTHLELAMAVLSILGAAVTVGLLCWVLRGSATARARMTVGTLVTLEALLCALPPMLSGTSDFRLDTAPIDYLRSHLGLSRFYAMGGALRPNYGAYFDLAMLNDNQLPLPNTWDNYAHILTSSEPTTAMFGIAGDAAGRIADFEAHRAAFTAASVAFLMLPAASDPLANRRNPLYQPVFDDGRTHIYRLPDAAPYFQTTGGPCTLTAASRDEMQAVCAAPATLLRREMAWRGWRARLNGKGIKVHTAGTFQTVDLPAGASRVVWWYAPPQAWLIALLFAAGVAWLAAMIRSTLRATGRSRAGAPLAPSSDLSMPS